MVRMCRLALFTVAATAPAAIGFAVYGAAAGSSDVSGGPSCVAGAHSGRGG